MLYPPSATLCDPLSVLWPSGLSCAILGLPTYRVFRGVRMTLLSLLGQWLLAMLEWV
jgi:hypothetical protein